MTDLTWEEPPPPKQRSFRDVPDALRAHPGEWARIAEYDVRNQACMLVGRIRRGEVKYWKPAGSFDAVARAVGDKHCVYARYVGETGEGR